MSRRSLLSWGNLDASINFPTDLLDSNSRFVPRMRPESESEGFDRQGEADECCDHLRMFGLQNTVNFCDVAARLPAVTFTPCIINQSGDDISNWEPSAALGKKGLKRMAGLLLRTILNRRFTSHQQVAAEVERLLGPRSQRQRKEEKNIKRRVYDALNVMIAAGVLERELQAVGRTTHELHFRNSSLSTRRNQIAAETDVQASRIARKRQLHARTNAQLQAVRRCLLKNKSTPLTAPRLAFPLIVLLQRQSSRIELELQEEQLLLKHPCLQIYSETDLLEQAWSLEGEGKEERTAQKLDSENEDILT